jgi:hypothetical protein
LNFFPHAKLSLFNLSFILQSLMNFALWECPIWEFKFEFGIN